MLHEPVMQNGNDPAFAYKRKLGVRMFLAYAMLYLGFIIINLLKPVIMETKIIAGLNLAVVYGFALIIIALILALYYNRAYRPDSLTTNYPDILAQLIERSIP